MLIHTQVMIRQDNTSQVKSKKSQNHQEKSNSLTPTGIKLLKKNTYFIYLQLVRVSHLNNIVFNINNESFSGKMNSSSLGWGATKVQNVMVGVNKRLDSSKS